MRLAIPIAALCAALVLAPAAPAAQARTTTAQVRLLNVCLDLQLAAVVYREFDTKHFAANIEKIAKQLHQPKPAIRQGRSVAALDRYPAGTVLVKVNAPPKTLILLCRETDGSTWRLVDDPRGRMHVGKLKSSFAT